jgi:hypothetical protein
MTNPFPSCERKFWESLRCVSREFLTLLGVAHFPTERGNSLAQFVTSFPISFPPCVLTLVCELRYFLWNYDFALSFEIENSVDSFPPIQHCAC